MSFNKIKRLDTNTFRGMRFLRRLYLSDNAIADVSRGTFGSLTQVGTIDLARNFLKKIDYQMFFQLKFIDVSGCFDPPSLLHSDYRRSTCPKTT
jgi:Leucine-rich repeat (LRR) protein